MLEFSTVGELIGPCCQWSPMDVCKLSVPLMLRLWQELQEIKPDLDSRGSKKSFLPNSIFALFLTAAAGIGWIGSLDNAQEVEIEIAISAVVKVPSFMIIPFTGQEAQERT